MKFGHQINDIKLSCFASAWRSQFVNYKPLKKLLMRIQLENDPQKIDCLHNLTIGLRFEEPDKVYVFPVIADSLQLAPEIEQFFTQLNFDLQHVVHWYTSEYQRLESFAMDSAIQEIAKFKETRNDYENIEAIRQLVNLLEDVLRALESNSSIESHWTEDHPIVSCPPTLLSLCSRRRVFHRKETIQFTRQLPDILQTTILLQEFKLVNLTAFRKILKKFDKHVGSSTMQSGMQLIQTSPMHSKPAVEMLLFRVKEALSEPMPELSVLSCGICLEVLHHPIPLPCGHLFCEICLKRAHRAGLHFCPYCRRDCAMWIDRYKSLLDKATEGKCRFFFPKEYKLKKKQDFHLKWEMVFERWRDDWRDFASAFSGSASP